METITPIHKAIPEGIGMNQPVKKTIRETRYKIRVKEDTLRKELTNSFKKMVYETCGKKDSITPCQRLTIAMLANWLSVDCTDGHRWVIMMGGIGNGKTTMLDATHYLVHWLSTVDGGQYRKAVNMSYVKLTANELVDMYKDNKSDYNIAKNTHMVFLDDLGTEPIMRLDYGNQESPIVDFLLYRYNHQLPLVMTSNLPSASSKNEPSQFEIRYGKRVRDRLNEMCMLVKFEDKSFRGMK